MMKPESISCFGRSTASQTGGCASSPAVESTAQHCPSDSNSSRTEVTSGTARGRWAILGGASAAGSLASGHWRWSAPSASLEVVTSAQDGSGRPDQAGAARSGTNSSRSRHHPMRATLACFSAGLVALLGTPARSEPLAETQAALARFPGHSALRVSIAVSVRTSEGDVGPRSSEVTFSAEHSTHGLRVLYPPELLDRLQAEAVMRADESPSMPASEILGDLGASELNQALDFGPALRHLIDGGSVLEARPASDGELARLVVRADPSRADATPYMKESELLITLWLDEDGVPTTVVTESRVKAGRLFINVTNQHRIHRELARVGDRLVVTRSEGRLSVSGLGQSFTKTVDTLIRVVHQGE